MKLKSDEVIIKGRGCADGRKQQDLISKEDKLSPTVSTEGLMLSCMIEAMEGQEVATADIPGAFLQNDYEKGDIHIKLEGVMVTLLEETDPESLIFWGKLSKSLEKRGYQINEYDWCFMNKIIDRKNALYSGMSMT